MHYVKNSVRRIYQEWNNDKRIFSLFLIVSFPRVSLPLASYIPRSFVTKEEDGAQKNEDSWENLEEGPLSYEIYGFSRLFSRVPDPPKRRWETQAGEKPRACRARDSFVRHLLFPYKRFWVDFILERQFFLSSFPHSTIFIIHLQTNFHFFGPRRTPSYMIIQL